VGPSGFQSQMADFNGDGKQDLIVAGSGANALGYRQGVGNGNFMPEQVLNAGSGLSAQGIVAVDYDGDGDMDLVAQEYVQSVANTGTITLYRNNGAASFTRVLLASGHPESYRVVAGDLNADGRTDLVYGKALSTVVYALQQPNGELGGEVVLPVTFGSAQGVLLGDMDNDNDLDIVVSNRANGVNAYFSVFSNDGNGVFSAPQSKATGIFPTALQLVDMNGDGRLDVVTAESVVGSRAGYYPQLANGTFGSRVVVLPTNTQLNSDQSR
jgi:membrane-bound lytic murein transglycosylase B